MKVSTPVCGYLSAGCPSFEFALVSTSDETEPPPPQPVKSETTNNPVRKKALADLICIYPVLLKSVVQMIGGTEKHLSGAMKAPP